jgi:hypothetical protein
MARNLSNNVKALEVSSVFGAALSTEFKREQIKDLLRVSQATGNIHVAIEILLGLYVEPEFPVNPTKYKNASQQNIEFVSYDPFTDRVNYRYKRAMGKDGWVDKQTQKMVSERYYPSDAMEELGIVGMGESTFREKYERKFIPNGFDSEWSFDSVSSSSW